jgi:hypothetical protein
MERLGTPLGALEVLGALERLGAKLGNSLWAVVGTSLGAALRALGLELGSLEVVLGDADPVPDPVPVPVTVPVPVGPALGGVEGPSDGLVFFKI